MYSESYTRAKSRKRIRSVTDPTIDHARRLRPTRRTRRIAVSYTVEHLTEMITWNRKDAVRQYKDGLNMAKRLDLSRFGRRM